MTATQSTPDGRADPMAGEICILGLGYVGLPIAVEFGKQRPVVGFDKRMCF